MKKEISAIETVDTVSAEKIIAASGKKKYRVVTREEEDVGYDVVGIYPTASGKKFRADMMTEANKFETAYDHFVKGWNQAVEDGVIVSEFHENVSAKLYTLKEWKAQKPDWKLEEDLMWLKAGEEADEVTFGYTDLGDYYYIFANVNLKEENDAEENAASVKVESINTPIETVDTVSVEVQVNSDITDAAIAEVTKEPVISTSELEYLLKGYKSEIETHKAAIEESVRHIKYYQNAIVEYMASIMKAEDFIADLGVEVMGAKAKIEWLEEETAKINAKLLSRQFNASALIETVKAAEKVEAVVPVTFDIQQFNEVVNAENAETIDTAVSKTEIPYIDEDEEFDAETKKLFEEVVILRDEVKDLQKQIQELKALQGDKWSKSCDIKETLKVRMQALKEWVCKEVDLGDKKISIKTKTGKFTVNGKRNKLEEKIYCSRDDDAIAICTADCGVTLAEYHSVKEFKAAIRELAAAIERGDKEFTFPADK